jgi:hypothetical protein
MSNSYIFWLKIPIMILIIVFSTSQRWCHGECDAIMNEEDAEKCAVAGYSCQLCRPADIPAPHIIQQAIESSKKLSNPSPPPSPEYSGMSAYSNANYVVDNVVLSERGMITLKAQTLEREKPKRRKRGMLGVDADKNMFDSMESGLGGSQSADNSMENDPDDDDDLMPPPTPGNKNLSICIRWLLNVMTRGQSKIGYIKGVLNDSRVYSLINYYINEKGNLMT